jgi:hypothetical protein
MGEMRGPSDYIRSSNRMISIGQTLSVDLGVGGGGGYDKLDVRYEGAESVHPDQNRVQWWASVKKVMNCRIS